MKTLHIKQNGARRQWAMALKNYRRSMTAFREVCATLPRNECGNVIGCGITKEHSQVERSMRSLMEARERFSDVFGELKAEVEWFAKVYRD